MERPGGKRTPTERSSPNIEWIPLEKPPEQPVAKAVWKRAGDSRRPVAPPPTAEVTWEKFDTPTLAAPPVAPRYERVQKTITFEQMERISTLEEGIQNARRGLKEIAEAFEAKAKSPDLRGLYADIDSWAAHYGPKEEDLREKLGRFADTQESRLRTDARQYYVLERNLAELVKDLRRYKDEYGLS